MKTHRIVLLCACAGGLAAAATPDVLTYHNDNARTGQQLNETVLTPANVNSSTFGKLFVISVDGNVDAEPLYAGGITIGGASHNVLVVATEHDSVYAFDADTGSTLWQVSMALAGETSSDDRGCSQITPEIGVTATPVIDLAAGPHGTVYVVAMSKNGAGQYFQRLHALDLTTGAEQFGGPMTVQATFPGTGDHSSGGNVIFDPAQYKDRASLLLLNGAVYTSWASHCDIRPYTGWMIGYNQNTLAQTTVLNVTPNGNEGAFWSAGAGPAADASGNIYALVGNGTFDTTLNGSGFPNQGDYGNSFLRISTNGGHLAVADYFTMFNEVAESNADEDLGSGGALVVPDLVDGMGRTRHLAVGAGKDAHIYVADRDNMGKFNPTDNSNVYQDIVGALAGPVYSMPAYFGGVIYYGAVGDRVTALPFSNALLASKPASVSATAFGYPGTTPSVSANGTSGGIVWAAENTANAVLHAYDAGNLGNELYNSSQAVGGRDDFGTGNKFITPMIANGKVYVGTINGVGVFGLLSASLPGSFALLSPANNASGVGTNAALSWGSSSGATSYDVYLGTGPFPPLATNTTGTSYGPGTLSAGTLYHWQVVSKNGSGSTPSAIWSFTTQGSAPPAPVLSSPANGATGISLTPTVNWSAAAGATSYDVHFGTVSPPPLAANTTGTSYGPGTLSAGTIYYWQVVAKNGSGSAASAIWSFTTQGSGPPAPVLISPTNGATGISLTPTVSWGAAAGATSYDVHFGTVSPPPLATNATGTSYVPGTLSAGTTYYWQVVAKNSDGSAASAIWAFTTQVSAPPAPVLLAPANGTGGVTLTPTLNWSAATGASSYDVYFGTTFPPPLATNTTGTSYAPGTLSPATVYYWQVAARNGGGANASATWQFTTQAAVPVLTAPANGATNVSVDPVLSWSAASGAISYDVYFGTAAAPPLATNTAGTSYAPGTLAVGELYFWRVVARTANGSIGSATWTFTTPYTTPAPAASQWVAVTPCRVADTRGAEGPFGGPSVGGGSSRVFAIPQSACGIPATATAYSLNVTVVPAGPLPYLTLWPAGAAQPLVSTLNSFDGSVVANAAIVPAGAGGAVSVFAANPTDVILDIDGYFEPAGAPNALAFYPTRPCRVADTRGAAGTFGGPSMGAGQTRDFAIPQSSCAIPSTAGAYSLNVTVVPDAVVRYLGYLSTWPAGQTRPLVSTLNSWAGKVVANAALVPAGNNGSISVFVTDPTAVILDVNGYFAAPGAAGALSFYPVTPCRVADTRNAAGPFGGPAMQARETRTFALPASGCSVPATAAAFSLNVTAVPEGPLQYLTAWPAGSAQPLVSTLNSWDGRVVANAAIVPAGANGAIEIFVTDPTNLVLDINGYFAP